MSYGWDTKSQCCCDGRPYPHDPEFWHGSAWPQVWTRRSTPGQAKVAAASTTAVAASGPSRGVVHSG